MTSITNGTKKLLRGWEPLSLRQSARQMRNLFFCWQEFETSAESKTRRMQTPLIHDRHPADATASAPRHKSAGLDAQASTDSNDKALVRGRDSVVWLLTEQIRRRRLSLENWKLATTRIWWRTMPCVTSYSCTVWQTRRCNERRARASLATRKRATRKLTDSLVNEHFHRRASGETAWRKQLWWGGYSNWGSDGQIEARKSTCASAKNGQPKAVVALRREKKLVWEKWCQRPHWPWIKQAKRSEVR